MADDFVALARQVAIVVNQGLRFAPVAVQAALSKAIHASSGWHQTCHWHCVPNAGNCNSMERDDPQGLDRD